MMNNFHDDSSFMDRLLELWKTQGGSLPGLSKAGLIDLEMLNTPDEQLMKESSVELFARLVFSLADYKQNEPVPKEKLEQVLPVIDPRMKAVVTHQTVKQLFGVSDATLKTYRDSGVVSFGKGEPGYLYEWDQVRVLFGTSDKHEKPDKSNL